MKAVVYVILYHTFFEISEQIVGQPPHALGVTVHRLAYLQSDVLPYPIDTYRHRIIPLSHIFLLESCR